MAMKIELEGKEIDRAFMETMGPGPEPEYAREFAAMDEKTREARLTGAASTTDDSGDQEAKDEGRPSLDVAIENQGNLEPRLDRLITRMLAWDTTDMGAENALRFRAACEDTRAAWDAMVHETALLKAQGYVARTTALGRLRAKLRPGTLVTLREDVAKDFAEAFPAEDLRDIRVVKLLATKVSLASSTRDLGLLPIGHVSPAQA